MFVPPGDRTLGEHEWRPFVVEQGFGQLIAPGAGREWPAVAATQFVLDDDQVLVHFAGPNPVLAALGEDPRAMLAVAGDWAYVPSDWKTIGNEDPRLGIPTTYYGAVQLRGHAEVLHEPARIAGVLRRQLAALQPGTDVADPEEAHPAKLKVIRAVVLQIDDVVAKFKYGGNVDEEHRRAVVARLAARGGPGDGAAAAHVLRRLDGSGPAG
ncbi:MAG TPA: FMN-binding negative transcriptional regulator [Acidimicrobiales bacterium]|jgi:transcriptional regulator|nr:FMN-binding negative transcriptional regulator [Acidimicrobiales bacterium]